MSISPLYIPAFSIEDVLLDKDTGQPLSGGLVYFFKDDQRGTLKPVYQITGTSPNYTFTQLPNPMTLSSIGTFVDALDNPVIPYFYPWVALDPDDPTELTPELYYIVVLSSGFVPQFTRQAQPYLPQEGNIDVLSAISNELSNPQFVVVNFPNPQTNYTYTFSNANALAINIAPDWDAVVTSPGSGTLTVKQLAPQGTLNIPSNPATLLNISSTGLTQLLLRQRIYGSPNLWGSGFLAGTFVAKTYSGTEVPLSLYYSQSSGAVVNELIATGILPASGYGEFAGASGFIPPSGNTNTFPGAYIDIYFDLPPSIELDITSVMVAFTGQSPISNIQYDQESYARQVDHLFHDYFNPLMMKPISSYLVGWDFPLNPAQLLGRTVGPQATGTNSSYYAWDQTIIFQSANSGVSIGGSNMTMTAAVNTQVALIQYLSAQQALDIFLQASISGGLSSNLRLSATTQQVITISLWWTANTSTPNVATGTNQSLVLGLDSNGHPSSVVSGWNEITRTNGQNCTFTTFNTNGTVDYGFNGWSNGTAFSTGRYFAIVVGTNTIMSGNNVDFKSISLVPGLIPTIPAPQTVDEVLRECQYYYEKSYTLTDVAPTNTTVNQKLVSQNAVNYPGGMANNALLCPTGFEVDYTPKRVVPTLKFYTPSGTADNVLATLYYAITGSHNFFEKPVVSLVDTFWNGTIGTNKATYVPKVVTGLVGADNASNDDPFVSGQITYQFVAEARLGIVL